MMYLHYVFHRMPLTLFQQYLRRELLCLFFSFFATLRFALFDVLFTYLFTILLDICGIECK